MLVVSISHKCIYSVIPIESTFMSSTLGRLSSNLCVQRIGLQLGECVATMCSFVHHECGVSVLCQVGMSAFGFVKVGRACPGVFHWEIINVVSFVLPCFMFPL